MKFTFLAIQFLLISFALSAQSSPIDRDLSAIIMGEDVEEQIRLWERKQMKKEELKVWRILVVGLRDRRSLNRAIEKFRKAFPDLEYDWEYDRPLYKLKTGVCVHQLDLKPLLYKIREEFPAALEIKDIMTYQDYFKLRS